VIATPAFPRHCPVYMGGQCRIQLLQGKHDVLHGQREAVRSDGVIPSTRAGKYYSAILVYNVILKLSTRLVGVRQILIGVW